MTELKPNKDALLMELAQAADKMLEVAQLLGEEIEVTITRSAFNGKWSKTIVEMEANDVKKM